MKFLVKIIGASVIFILLLSLSACVDSNQSEANQSDSSYNPDQLFFQSNCGMCHGPDGEGEQIGDKRVPDLRSKGFMLLSDEQLFQLIANGSGAMPAFKNQIEAGQIREMVKYIRQEIQKRK